MGTATTKQDLLYPGNATDFFARRQFKPFDPTNVHYSVANALWLAELSRIVYRHDSEEDSPPPQPTRDSFLARAGLRLRRFFKADKELVRARAMLVESTSALKFAVLVFRGTEQNIKDFWTDLRVGSQTLRHLSVPAVHQGFKDALDLIWDGIDAELSMLQGPLFYTGHSLGAALATLAAARRRPDALYTFGSPRVGNKLFATSLSGLPVHRVVDDEDIVATVPPEALGYFHVGDLHLKGPELSFASRLRYLFNPPKFLADHAPVNYVDRI